MARYFFHVDDGTQDLDLAGTELSSDDAARLEAIRYAGSVLQDRPDILRRSRDLRVEVTDEEQLLLFTVVMVTIDASWFERT